MPPLLSDDSTLPFALLNAFPIPSPSGFEPNSGNQAAVVVLPPAHPRVTDTEWCAITAKNINVPVTAFASARIPEDADPERETREYGLRWWSYVGVELILCGHATLATSAYLFAQHPSCHTLIFHTQYSGTFSATRADGGKVAMMLPSAPIEDDVPGVSVGDVAAALGLQAGEVEALKGYQWYGQSLIVEVAERVDLRKLKLDEKRLLELSRGQVVVTLRCTTGRTRESSRLKTQSRGFTTMAGFHEDPATGSAHAALTGYYLTPSSGYTALDAYQLSERGGRMECSKVEGQEGKARVVAPAQLWGEGRVSCV